MTITTTQRKKFEEMLMRKANEERQRIHGSVTIADAIKYIRSSGGIKHYNAILKKEKQIESLEEEIKRIELQLDGLHDDMNKFIVQLKESSLESESYARNKEDILRDIIDKVKRPKLRKTDKFLQEARDDIWLVDAGENMKAVLEAFQKKLASI